MQEIVTAKPWWKSSTLWFNAIAGAGVLIDWMVIEGFSFVENPLFAGIITVVNLALRFKTNQPVASEVKTVSVSK